MQVAVDQVVGVVAVRDGFVTAAGAVAVRAVVGAAAVGTRWKTSRARRPRAPTRSARRHSTSARCAAGPDRPALETTPPPAPGPHGSPPGRLPSGDAPLPGKMVRARSWRPPSFRYF